eukprot:CAMPEP_0170513080 /NCGR_PEP_ID=MMETSP0208-20121228/67200_1 /TAXON_ID=197538 /ORGANISM="Strombidium inclinatum, Strain S3" /LENGTH=43 /DNA_ID= /DNA_START= /DNA_END= /DNA_ORIENTATION=
MKKKITSTGTSPKATLQHALSSTKMMPGSEVPMRRLNTAIGFR